MKVEISKAQKEALGNKIDLCVAFLKKEVQPHLVPTDKLVIAMGEVLDLCITSKEIYVIKTRAVSCIATFYVRSSLLLERPGRKNSKKYICEDYPELAVEFLKHWDKAKQVLSKEVQAKEKEVSDLDNFVDSFRL